MDPTQEYWELRHEDEIWTASGQYVGTCENPDYPSNSSLVMYIVDMHNAQIDKIKNSVSTINPDYGNMAEQAWEES